jgi:hypothetical protein
VFNKSLPFFNGCKFLPLPYNWKNLPEKEREREKEIIMWKLTVAQLVMKFSTI